MFHDVEVRFGLLESFHMRAHAKDFLKISVIYHQNIVFLLVMRDLTW